MKVGVSELVGIINKYGDRVPKVVYLNDVKISSSVMGILTFKRGSEFSPKHAEALKESGISEIDIVYSDRVLGYLINLYPDKYRMPYKHLTFFQLDKVIQVLSEINKRSKRKREIVSCFEKYHKKGERLVKLIEYGERVEWNKWNEVKVWLPKKEDYPIQFSERGIIVFVDLRPGGKDYLQRFYRNSDLVTLLVGKRSDVDVVIAPDFNGDTDVYTVDNPDNLLKTYIETNARLIIVGDALTDEYKKALAQVKAYDRYARFMLAVNIDLRKAKEFLTIVAKNYRANVWKWDDF